MTTSLVKNAKTTSKKRSLLKTGSFTVEPVKESKKSSDLLDFVTALDEMDAPDDIENFETFADIPVTADKKKKKDMEFGSKMKHQKSSVKSLAAAGDADFEDFTAILDGEDTSFVGLKKRMPVISGSEEGEAVGDNVSGNSSKKRSKSILVEAPLPSIQQQQIDRSVAYEKTVKDVSKWTGIIQKNRDAHQLRFPLIQQQATVKISSHSLVSSFTPTTEFEKEISSLIAKDGIAPKNVSESTGGAYDELPTNHLDPEQVYKEIAKTRSSKFFTEIKARRQAKIKSKKYRKILAKERMKAEAEAISAGNLSELGKLGMLLSNTAEDEEIRRERKMKAEMDRARERLTLRTRKVNKWAQELLSKRHGDADGRLKVLEQLKEKERLRQEIYGVNEMFEEEEEDDSQEEEEAEEEENSDSESHQYDGNDSSNAVDDYEVQEIFDRVKSEATIVTGRHKFGNNSEIQRAHDYSDDEEENLDKEIEKSILRKDRNAAAVKTPKITANSEAVIDDFEGQESNDEYATENYGDLKWNAQKNLIREAFADNDVFSDFAAEKSAIVEAEAPKVEDVTLPGWGVWGGAGLTAEQSLPTKRFVIHKKGLDPKARLDKNLKHVIINERRIKAAAKAFTIPKTPFPFSSADMHARHIAQPIGREWNTITSHKKRIQPRITTKAGSIIKPIKFFKQSKHV